MCRFLVGRAGMQKRIKRQHGQLWTTKHRQPTLAVIAEASRNAFIAEGRTNLFAMLRRKKHLRSKHSRDTERGALRRLLSAISKHIAVNSRHRPQRGHIYVAAIAAVGKRWRTFLLRQLAMFQKPKTVQNKCKAFAMLR